jgi:hypothetical protein
MRTARFAFSLAVLALAFSSSYAAHGQIFAGGGGGAVYASGGDLVAPGGSGTYRGPYTAVRKLTHVQKLADGTTVTHETTRKEARDSSGRTYFESRDGLGEAQGMDMYNVTDPVSRIYISWVSNLKVVHVTHMQEPTQIPQVQLPQPPPISSAAPPPVSQRPAQPMPVQPRQEIEKLGTKTINGFEAEGTRRTRIIPAGSEGNDRPIAVTSETWISPEFKMLVMSIDDDPRSWTTTMDLTDFERGEPDPALFQVPEGYTVKEEFPNQPN